MTPACKYLLRAIVAAAAIMCAASPQRAAAQSDSIVVIRDRYASRITLGISAGDHLVVCRTTATFGKMFAGVLFAGAGTGIAFGNERIHDAPTTYSVERYRRERIVLLPVYAELRWHFPEAGRVDLYMVSRIGADFGLFNTDAVDLDGMLGAGIGLGRISLAVAYEYIRQRGMITTALSLDF